MLHWATGVLASPACIGGNRSGGDESTAFGPAGGAERDRFRGPAGGHPGDRGGERRAAWAGIDGRHRDRLPGQAGGLDRPPGHLLVGWDLGKRRRTRSPASPGRPGRSPSVPMARYASAAPKTPAPIPSCVHRTCWVEEAHVSELTARFRAATLSATPNGLICTPCGDGVPPVEGGRKYSAFCAKSGQEPGDTR